MPFFALLAVFAQVQASQSTAITVTGHPWAPFISPMGEPYRARTPSDDTLSDWFQKADRNQDGFLTVDEFEADADRFFAKLDTDHDGEIGPDELSAYEYEIAPEIQVMSRTRPVAGHPAQTALDKNTDDDDGPDIDEPVRHRDQRRTDEINVSLGIAGALQGAARYSLLNMPEPVAAADVDFNRSITLEEFRKAAIARFQILDSAHQNRLTLAQLEAMPHAPVADQHHGKRKLDAPDARIGNPLPQSP